MTTTTEKREIPASALRFSSSDVNIEDNGNFILTPFAGQVFEHAFWGKMTFDMDSLNMRKQNIPALLGHDWEKPVGVIKGMKKGEAVVLTGEFIDNEHTQNLQKMREKGLEWECSFGMDPEGDIEYIQEGVTTEINGAEFEGPGHIMKGSFHEVSFTHYGAVPDTDAEFNKKISVNVFSNSFLGGKSMSDAQNQSDLDKSKEEGRNEFKALFSKMNEACDDATFVNECMAEGISFEDFQTKLVEKLKSEKAEADQKIADFKAEADKAPVEKKAEGSTEPVGHSESGAATDSRSFAQKARDLSKKDEISLREAYSRLISTDPNGFKSFKVNSIQKEGK